MIIINSVDLSTNLTNTPKFTDSSTIMSKKMFNKLKQNVSLHYLNSQGWKTNRNIIVIESDDWGSIRMPNKDVYKKCLEKGLKVNNCPFNTFDTLANNDDFTAIFKSLLKYRDKNGNTPIITANTIMANPDFERIAESKFAKYSYEPFTKTLEDYYPGQNIFSRWQEGMEQNLFHPQFHGREHLYIKRWQKFLFENSEESLFTFQNSFFGISTNITKENRGTYLAALDFENLNEIEGQKDILREGLQLFKNTFNYNSKSFIAPNYTWHEKLEPYLKELGVETIQGGRAQRVPSEGHSTSVRKHKMGEYSGSGQVFLIRNVQFEPSINKNINWHKYVISQVQNAFLWKQPAIISSHRLNFIGSLHENNRTQNLILLEGILSEILKKWPNVEFMTSDKLGQLIKEETTNG